jgi:hypothetical protein
VSAVLATGTLTLSTVLLYSFLNGMTPIYLLGLIHYLDHSAAAALARFRLVLTVDDPGYQRLCYQLTTLPARPTLLAAALGVVYGLATLLINVISAQNPGVTSAQTPGSGAGSPVAIVLIWVSIS